MRYIKTYYETLDSTEYEDEVIEEKPDVIYIIYTMDQSLYWDHKKPFYKDVIDFYEDIKDDVKFGYEVFYSPNYPNENQECFVFVFNRIFDVPHDKVYRVREMTKKTYSELDKWDFMKLPDNDVETFINAKKYNL